MTQPVGFAEFIASMRAVLSVAGGTVNLNTEIALASLTRNRSMVRGIS